MNTVYSFSLQILLHIEHPTSDYDELIPIDLTLDGNFTGHSYTIMATRITLRLTSTLCREYNGFTLEWKGVFISNVSSSTAASESNSPNMYTSTTTRTADSGMKDVMLALACIYLWFWQLTSL